MCCGQCSDCAVCRSHWLCPPHCQIRPQLKCGVWRMGDNVTCHSVTLILSHCVLVWHRHRDALPWLANSETSRDDDRKFLIPLEQYLSACHHIVDSRYDHQSQHCVECWYHCRVWGRCCSRGKLVPLIKLCKLRPRCLSSNWSSPYVTRDTGHGTRHHNTIKYFTAANQISLQCRRTKYGWD